MKRTLLLRISLVLFCMVLAVSCSTADSYHIPEQTNDSWQTASLDEVGLERIETRYAPTLPLAHYSLKGMNRPRPVLSESYAPANLVLTMEKLTPELIRRFHSRATYRAYITDPYKLLQIEGVGQQLFKLDEDPLESQDLASTDLAFTEMAAGLDAELEQAIARRPADMKLSTVELSSDKVTRRLRGLGYLD